MTTEEFCMTARLRRAITTLAAATVAFSALGALATESAAKSDDGGLQLKYANGTVADGTVLRAGGSMIIQLPYLVPVNIWTETGIYAWDVQTNLCGATGTGGFGCTDIPREAALGEFDHGSRRSISRPIAMPSSRWQQYQYVQTTLRRH